MAKKINVLVSGVGAIIGQAIMKSLRMSALRINVIGMDMNPLAAGFHFADKTVVCPAADSKDFIPWVIDICNREKIDLILPGIPQELRAFSTGKDDVEGQTKARLVINSPEALEIGSDKWKTYLFLSENSLPTPTTFLPQETDGEVTLEEIGFPYLLKLREGSAGKGMVLIHDIEEYQFYTTRRNDYIAQEYIGSDEEEYTCGIFGKRNGTHTDAIVMKRKISYGSTFQATAGDYEDVKKVVIQVANKLKLLGPTNIQLRKHNGVPMVIEINPRFSSCTSLRAAFGFNEAEMCVRHFLLNEDDLKVEIKKGFAQRYIEDLIVDIY